MKTNKKAILGFAVAMVFSLGLMQGINQKSIQQNDMNIQQVGAGMIIAGAEEGGGMGAAIGFYGGAMLAYTAESAPVWGSMGPVGWIIGGGMAL